MISKKAKYINKCLEKYKNLEIYSEESSFIYSLILTLTPKETCVFFRFLIYKKNISSIIKKWVKKKILNDIKIKYYDFHDKFLERSVKFISSEKSNNRVLYCSFINSIFDVLPDNKKVNLIDVLLRSKYKVVRNIAYRRGEYCYNKCKELFFKKLEEKKDIDICVNIIFKYGLEHENLEYLISIYNKFSINIEEWLIKKLFLKVYDIFPDKFEEIKKDNPVIYSYVLFKKNKKINKGEAKNIIDIVIKNNQNIGAVLFYFGKIGLWEDIRYFEEQYLNK